MLGGLVWPPIVIGSPEFPPSPGDRGQRAQCGDRQREPQAREPRDEQGKVSKTSRGCARPWHSAGSRSCRLGVVPAWQSCDIHPF